MTLFSKIIAGDIPSYKIYEDDLFLAFLDISPIQEGHVLVIPKVEEDYFFNLEDDCLAKMILFSKKVALAIKDSIPCKKIGLAVIGLEVPHAHIHLLPLNEEKDICFSNPRITPTSDELLKTAQKIRAYFES